MPLMCKTQQSASHSSGIEQFSRSTSFSAANNVLRMVSGGLLLVGLPLNQAAAADPLPFHASNMPTTNATSDAARICAPSSSC